MKLLIPTLLLIFGILVSFPLVTVAAIDGAYDGVGYGGGDQATGGAGGDLATGGAGGDNAVGNMTLFNPLGPETSIYDIANAILDILMVFAVPIILFFIVWAGFLYVTAGGNQDQISKATKALTYAVIGGVIVLGAKVLLEVITNTVNVFG